MKYRFSPAADKRQDEIWAYTVQTWGEDQAVRYIKGLHKAIQNAAADPKSWHKVNSPNFPNIFYIRYEKHFIFFRLLSDGVLGVIDILHERMDIPNRLKDI